MANYPQFSTGYRPSDYYSGNMTPPTAQGGKLYPTQLPQSQGSPQRGMTTGSVVGSGTLYDAQNDPRFPVSPGFQPGTWATGGAPKPQVASGVQYYPGSLTSQNGSVGYHPEGGAAPSLVAIQNSMGTSVPLPRTDPRGYAATTLASALQQLPVDSSVPLNMQNTAAAKKVGLGATRPVVRRPMPRPQQQQQAQGPTGATRFLQQQGKNTAGMNDAQIQMALNKAIF